MEIKEKKWFWGMIAAAVAAAATVIATSLQSCSSMYTLNKAIKYEYELNRMSTTETQTHLRLENGTDGN